MVNKALYDQYNSLVQFFGLLADDETEVALHDLSDIRHSIVSISNGAVTGRQIGDPFTPQEKERVDIMIKTGENYIANFKGPVYLEKIIQSSVLVLRSPSNEAVGAITINVDMTQFIGKANRYGLLLYMPDNALSPDKPSSDNVSELSVADMIAGTLMDLYGTPGVNPQKLSTYEKIKIVEQLRDKKVFLIKGAVSIVADSLSMSESSIYRYLKQLKKNI